MRSSLLVLATVSSVWLTPALRLSAQVLSGQVVDSVSGAPAGASFVVLIDAHDQEVARALTTSAGEFLLRAPVPGIYRLRSERIGYRVTVSPPVELGRNDTLQYTFQILPIPVKLAAVEVAGRPVCREDSARAAASIVVWEEIRKALAATAWDAMQQLVRYRKYSYERELTPNRRRVTREQGRVAEGVAGQPYQSLPSSQLADEGYVVTASDDTTRYALPDAQVLLSDAFLRTHCFHAVRDRATRPDDVGLAFRPIPDRDVADVRGVMWLDEATGDLKTLEVVYTLLPGGFEDDRAGGTVDFLRLPSGAWIVQRWEVRTPVTRVVQRDPELRVRGFRTDAKVVAWRDVGGEVLEIRMANGGTLYPANLAHVVGVVYDSTWAAPLPSALVAIDRTGFSVRTDAAGKFHLTAPLEGDYSLTVAHPWLDSLGYRAVQHTVRLSRGAVRQAAIVIPHARSWLSQLCGTKADGSDAGTVVGTVREPDGAPAKDVPVTASWQTFVIRNGRVTASVWKTRTATDETGFYTLCALPTDRWVSVRAQRDGQASRSADLILPAAEGGSQVLFSWDRRPGEGFAHAYRRTFPMWKVDLVLDPEEGAFRDAPRRSGREGRDSLRPRK